MFPVDVIADAISAELGRDAHVRYVTGDRDLLESAREATADPGQDVFIGVTAAASALARLTANRDALQLDLSRLTFVGAVGNSALLLTSARTDLTSFDDLMSSGAPLSLAASPHSRHLISSQMVAKMFGLSVTISTQYDTTDAVVQAVKSGHEDLGVVSVHHAFDRGGTSFSSELAPLMLMGDVPEECPASEASTQLMRLEDCAHLYPPTSDSARSAAEVNRLFWDAQAPAIAFFLPPGIPTRVKAAAEHALVDAMSSEPVARALAAVAVPRTPVPATEVATWFRRSVQHYGHLIRETAINFIPATRVVIE